MTALVIGTSLNAAAVRFREFENGANADPAPDAIQSATSMKCLTGMLAGGY